jgi:hypothetical protein
MEIWDREELYAEVWEKPLTALVAKYGVSAVAIGKTCRKLQVPLPGRGYWAKKAHGHPVTRRALPKISELPRIVRYQRPPVVNAVSSPPSKPEFPVEEEDKVEIDRIDQMLSAGAFVVKKPRKALRHPLIVAARNILHHAFVSKAILQTPWNESCLDVRVSKTCLVRALAIMAAVIAVLEESGAKVKVAPCDQQWGGRSIQTVATILGERIQFGISERTRHVRTPDSTATPDAAGRQRFVKHYETTGELSIQVLSNSSYFGTTWRDTEQAKIELLVPECVASMMKIAVEYRRNTATRHQEELFRKLRWEELQQLKMQIDAEENRIQRLETRTDDWHRARRMREYILALVDSKKEQGKELAPDTALGRWATWALQQADRIDPLVANPSSILDRKRELDGWSPYGWR